MGDSETRGFRALSPHTVIMLLWLTSATVTSVKKHMVNLMKLLEDGALMMVLIRQLLDLVVIMTLLS